MTTELHASNSPGSNLIFVVGAPRSGTFWTQRMITSHAQIDAVTNETHLFSTAIAPLTESFQHATRGSPSVGLSFIERQQLIEHVRSLCDSVLQAHQTSPDNLICERSPSHIDHIELISEVYPGARFVHVYRDGRDVIRSQIKHDWGKQSLEPAAIAWRDSVLRGRGIGDEAGIQLRYESLHRNPGPSLLRLYEWLGVDDPEAAAQAAVSAGALHVNRDPSGTSVGIQKWRQELSGEQVAAIESAAGDVLADLGYETGLPSTRRSAPSSSPRGLLARLRTLHLRAPLNRLRGLRSGPAEVRSDTPHLVQTTFDRFLAHARRGEGELIAAMMHPESRVAVVPASGPIRRASPGDRLIAEAIRADSALKKPELSAWVHLCHPTVVAVIDYRADDGPQRRLFAVTVREGVIQIAVIQTLTPPHARP